MPYRRTVLAEGEVYHTFCRGIFKWPTFKLQDDYRRASDLIDFYRYEKPILRYSHVRRLSAEEKKRFDDNLRKSSCEVDIIAFCMMPNHVHFLLKQLTKKGVSAFMSNFQNSYAHYFNTRHDMRGPVFEGMFKAVRVESDEQLLHVSRYIHLNPVSAYIIEKDQIENYPWSSYLDYVGKAKTGFLSKELVTDFFRDEREYQKFVNDQADYQRRLQDIKHLTLEK